MTDLVDIAAAAYRYARHNGATPNEAEDIAEHVVKRCRKATEHAVTRGGTAPERWRY